MAKFPRLDASETGYLVDGATAFDRRFVRAMSFHAPEGLAAVQDESGAYHIDTSGRPRYPQRYLEAFGFYDGAATVRDEAGYFHIGPDGRPLHPQRFRWAGNFQEGLCAVQDAAGFFHVSPDGNALYDVRYRYAGDFRYGAAVVHGPDGARHIQRDGSYLHSRAFLQAGVFHKGYAVVEDDRGAHHVGKRGAPLHAHRFRSAEPFYNGFALCQTHRGHLVRLRESGFYEHLPAAVPRITAEGVRNQLAAGRQVGLLLRHAERGPIRSGWGDEVLLTEEGLAQARSLGSLFRGHAVRLHSSPIERCLQTARGIANGAENAQEPRPSTWLGDPGPFTDPDQKHGAAPTEFADLATSYVATGRAIGMRPLEVASESLLSWLETELGAGLTVFVTHDFFAAGLMKYLGLKAPTRHDWADLLEGVCLVTDAAGTLQWHRFLGLEEIGRC